MNVVNCAIKSSIALFAFSPLASASLITGDVNQQITGQGNYYVDLDGDSVNDFNFYHHDYSYYNYTPATSNSTYRRSAYTTSNENQYTNLTASGGFSFLASPLMLGETISADDNFITFGMLAQSYENERTAYNYQYGSRRRYCNSWGKNCRYYTSWGNVYTAQGYSYETQTGSWIDDALANGGSVSGYVGFKKTDEQGNDYLGWLELSLNTQGEGTIGSYGLASGSNISTLNAGEAPAPLAAPQAQVTTDVSAPGVLGLMSLGIGGLALARRRRTSL